MMFYRNAGAGGWIRGWQSAQVGHTNKRFPYQGPYHPIILSPSRAVIMAEAGMSKQDAQAWLHKNCTISLKSVLGTRGMAKDASGAWLEHPEVQHLENDPEATIPALESPEQYLLILSGGPTHYPNFFLGTCGLRHRLLLSYPLMIRAPPQGAGQCRIFAYSPRPVAMVYDRHSGGSPATNKKSMQSLESNK